MEPFYKSFWNFAFIVVFAFLNFACENQENKNNLVQNESSVVENKVLISIAEIYESLPSPVETANLITEAGVKFDPRILNPVKNVPYYETSKSLALNLGVYCADISYVSCYEQKQLSMDYLSAIKTLADNLELSQLIDKNDITRIEDNLYERDSIKQIVKEIFFSSGKYLNENNQPEMALLVQTGAWVEGLYIAMRLATQSIKINKELVDRIAEQRKSLKLVVKSLKAYSDYAVVYDVYKDLSALQKIYNKTLLESKDTIQGHKVDSLYREKVNITPEIFVRIYKETNKIRNSYTQ